MYIYLNNEDLDQPDQDLGCSPVDDSKVTEDILLRETSSLLMGNISNL